MAGEIARTKAEQGLLDMFAKAAPRLPGAGWVADARRSALATFERLGLPHRRLEQWKYTDLRAGLKDAAAPAVLDKRSFREADIAAALGPELAALPAIELVFVNGEFLKAEMPASKAPGAEYAFDPLGPSLGRKGFEWLRPHLERAGKESDAVLALNAAFVTDGALLRIKEGARLDLPLHLIFLATGAEPASTATRSLIRIGKGARCTILESHVGERAAARQSNAAIEIEIEDGAELDHIKLIDEGGGIHLGSARVTLGAEATYRGFQMTAGIGIARNGTAVTFAGEGAKLDLSGVFLARGSEHVDTTLVVDHAVPRCESRELFKGVLDGRARGVFQGKIIVRPDAQKSDGKQMAQALMLSPDAEFDSKPELEIYADDVVCGHGSTAAELDPDLLFYCRARGIPLKEAQALLIQSFVGEALDKIAHAAIREAFTARAARWLAAGRAANGRGTS